MIEGTMSILHETQRILHAYGVTPKKRLGQNFIIDAGLLHLLVSYAQISGKDVILEIGAGLGFLTRLLSERCKRVIAVEIDPKLTEMLRSRLSDLKNVTIMQGDILKLSTPPFSKVISAPPYFISSSILSWLLERKFKCAVLIFQKEFAERLVAQSNSKNYGRLAVVTYYSAEVELLDPVPRDVFWPKPSVDSVIVRLSPKKPPFYVRDEKVFFDLVSVLFTERNRKIKNAIRPFLKKFGLSDREVEEWSGDLSFINRRTRELAPEDFGVVANEIADRMHEKGLL